MQSNYVRLMGNLGNDPELRFTGTGTAVCNFRMATNERWIDSASGAKKEKTEWHRIVVWGKQAENCAQYLTKGSEVLLEGKLRTREWTDKDGSRRFTTEIDAVSVKFMTRASNKVQAEQKQEDHHQEEIPEMNAEAQEVFGS